MSKFHSMVSRRDFMKAVGLTGAVLGASAALTAPVFHDLDEAMSAEAPKKPWYVKERALENPTTEIDYTIIKPYDNTQTLNNATFASQYIPGYSTTVTAAGCRQQTAWILANNPGYRVKSGRLAPELPCLFWRTNPGRYGTPPSTGARRQ